MTHPESPGPPSGDASTREDLPPVRLDGIERRLDPRAIRVWQIGGAIGSAIVIGAALVATVVQMFTFLAGSPFRVVLLGAGLVFCVAVAARAVYWPVLRYRHTSYRLDERGMWIRRGVVWRSEITLPRVRVQHTDVSRGPIERSYGLATLIVHTAGTRHASVELDGLAAEEAERIRDELIDGGDGDAV